MFIGEIFSLFNLWKSHSYMTGYKNLLYIKPKKQTKFIIKVNPLKIGLYLNTCRCEYLCLD